MVASRTQDGKPGLARRMEESDGEDRLRRGWVRWLGAGTGSLALVLLALWTQRSPIAENFVNRELARRDVRADYDLVDVGLRTQRIENVVLGDPARPDLTARWVEIDIAFAGLTPEVAAVRAGGVRLRGAISHGALTLGEVDKLRSPASQQPFDMPDLVLRLQDARLTLDTDAGRVGMQIDGSGNIRSGFSGRMAAAMVKASAGGCGATAVRAMLEIRTSAGRPRFKGPVQAGALGCRAAGFSVAQPEGIVDVTLGPALNRWEGRADLEGEALRTSMVTLAKPEGRLSFDGTAKSMKGRATIAADAIGGAGVAMRDALLRGQWAFGGGGMSASGQLSGSDLRRTGRDALGSLVSSSRGTPVGPLVERVALSVKQAERANRLRASFAFRQHGSRGSLAISRTALTSVSGARVGLGQGSSLALAWPGRRGGMDWTLDGSFTTGGGGLPHGALRLTRRPAGGFGGDLFLDPYAAADARLAVDRVRFVADKGGTTRFVTTARLDGPLPDGHVRGLVLPIGGRVAADGSLAVNSNCVAVKWNELRYASFVVDPVRQTLCPAEGGSMLMLGRSGLRGGFSARDLILNGQNGDSTMRLEAKRAAFELDGNRLALSGASLRIGSGESPVRLSAAALGGRPVAQGFAGTVSGMGGQIGSVPLILQEGAGDWGFAAGALSLRAAVQVRDAASPSRFEPLAIPDAQLRMRAGRIDASGTLSTPRSGIKVAEVGITHDLGSGRGHADLNVPGLTFGPALQPEEVTRLTVGVIANVSATVTGKGRIDWTGANVTSSGTFRTDNASLAAAFGPVEGLSGAIRFTDLIGLVSAPGQEVRIKSVNPGVEVRDGIVRYRLEPGQRVRIEGGGWPFSGGQLVLLPTTMDFSADVDRYMTFRVIGLDAGAFIQAMELENVSATGTFDGIMPLIFNAQGGRVAGGVLVARQQGLPPLIMPEGVLPTIPCDPGRQGGVLSYVGPVSNENLGAMGKLAFDALKNLQYKCLSILMDGALDGEMVTNVVFNGVNRGKIGDAPAGLARNFTGLPFIFNVKIAAPFRGLLKTAQSYIDPTQTIRDEIGRQAQEKMRAQGSQGLAVQPLDSDTMRNGEPK